MPRVTRRSVAPKEETPKESPKSGRRGAKKEEPAEEDLAPQATTPKRGGRQAAKEVKAAPEKKKTTSARGRSTSRGGRGKKEEEPEVEEEESAESEHEEEEEEKDDTPPAKGKGRASRGRKSVTGKGRGGRGRKAAEEDEEEEEAEENAENEEAEEAQSTPRGRGGRRGKAAVTPSPQTGRRGRGKAAVPDDKGDEDVEESKDAENEVETTPKGHGRQTPNEEAKPAASSGGRRGRGQKAEPASKTPPASGRSGRRGGGAEAAAAEEVPADKDDEEKAAEPMETSEEKAEPSKTETTEKEHAEEMATEPAISTKKRSHEDDEDKQVAKRAKTSDEPAEDELDSFVVVSKDDIPPHDSKEVTESLPPVAASEPTTPEDTSSEGPKVHPIGPGDSFVVPLTEVEITKQYSQQQMDKDETSSTLVEVGSECASDVTGLSSRGLDISDAAALESTDLAAGEEEESMDVTKDPPASGPHQGAPPGQQANAGSSQHNSSNAAPADSQTSSAALPDAGVNSDASQPAQCSTGVQEVHAGTAPSENACSASAPQSQAPSQNGTIEDLEPQISPNPGKISSAVPENYVPSSTAIDSRKFINNPAFPIEMMDPAFCFSVVSYNILADCHLRRFIGDYSYTQPQFLEQMYRHELMLKELDYLDGDIVCLQEVNPAYYTNTLLPAMKSRGFDGHFIKRTKDYYDEGEATFAKTSKFDIVSHQSVSLGDLAFKEVDDSSLNEDVSRAAKKYLDRADVILLTELQCKKTGRTVTVCNIHVVYDLKAPDVQCIQIACAVKQLVTKAGSDLSPHIICGDFNSAVASLGYQLAKDGYLSDADIQKLQTLENLDNVDGSSRSLIHHMWRAFQHTSSNLKSAYELTLGKEPPVTSYTKSTHKTLDYIFHSAASIETVGVLETLDLPVVDATGGLPSACIPSDHLSLKAKFRLK